VNLGLDGVVAAWEDIARRHTARAAIHPLGSYSNGVYELSGQAAALTIARYLDDGERVVDFGAGDGRVAIPLHDAGFDVIAVDASPTMLDRLQAKRPAIPTVRSTGIGLLEDLDGPVGVVFSLAVLIHHSHEDGHRLIGELARALEPEGLLLLDLPLYDVPRERAAWRDVTVWTLADLELTAAEFELTILEANVSPGSFAYTNIGAHHGDLVVLRGAP
jgi:SAM-dependent methyltransferase